VSDAPVQPRALIVEDERLARVELVSMIRADGRLRIIGEAATLDEAVSLVTRLEPEVIFLDIRLGADSGFALLDHCGLQEIIFVTAHDEHAVRAFEVNALDYLLKPVVRARLTEAIDRVLPGQRPGRPAAPSIEEDDRLFLRLDDGWDFIRVREIAVILADGNYSRIRTLDGAERLVQKPLQEWEARLPSRKFVRVHRSTIANVDLIERTVEWSNYSYRLHIRGLPEPVVMSRRYALRLKRLLG
jgi:two-component system LytT family response regulator